MGQTENPGINLGTVSHNTVLLFLQKPPTYPSVDQLLKHKPLTNVAEMKHQETPTDWVFSARVSLGNYRLLLRAKER